MAVDVKVRALRSFNHFGLRVTRGEQLVVDPFAARELVAQKLVTTELGAGRPAPSSIVPPVAAVEPRVKRKWTRRNKKT